MARQLFVAVFLALVQLSSGKGHEMDAELMEYDNETDTDYNES
eukprot:CAMPEP_0197648066 /NCGR_PEP_ID=MMETSP1338-20131121/27439_1 /TAXON_ID=43686 ORGANISM="Pelagodinium beii, Strain RCC1491" /NCGR_SAMPLE_ID=MMETSP1338 /ASSEMBLY_ACC=CAM_ASM_000754 /LENGTH=42 /DNA_ID= /DNA_START= /DNA_END= /DNA_ORIENTATION=